MVRFTNAHCRIEEDIANRVLRYTRNEVAFQSLDELERSFHESSAAIDRLGRDGYGLLVDLRVAPGSNNPEFEQVVARSRKKLVGGFRRVAVLVSTFAGALQVQRHAREDGGGMVVFREEAEALAYLAGQPKPSDRPRSSR
jgi:hypothetical protein